VQVSGQLACRSVPSSADRCRTVRPHPGPMILFLDVESLHRELPSELPGKSAETRKTVPANSATSLGPSGEPDPWFGRQVVSPRVPSLADFIWQDRGCNGLLLRRSEHGWRRRRRGAWWRRPSFVSQNVRFAVDDEGRGQTGEVVGDASTGGQATSAAHDLATAPRRSWRWSTLSISPPASRFSDR